MFTMVLFILKFAAMKFLNFGVIGMTSFFQVEVP